MLGAIGLGLVMVGMLDSLSLKNTKLGLETLELMKYDPDQRRYSPPRISPGRSSWPAISTRSRRVKYSMRHTCHGGYAE